MQIWTQSSSKCLLVTAQRFCRWSFISTVKQALYKVWPVCLSKVWDVQTTKWTISSSSFLQAVHIYKREELFSQPRSQRGSLIKITAGLLLYVPLLPLFCVYRLIIHQLIQWHKCNNRSFIRLMHKFCVNQNVMSLRFLVISQRDDINM